MHRTRGFTLIELVIVIVILGVLSAMTLPLLQAGFNAYVTQRDISDANWQGRLALARFTRDVQSLSTTATISSATNTQFTFVDAANSTVAYQLSASQLQRNGLTLANGVNSLGFAYYDAAGASTATLASIRYVLIALTITHNNVNTTLRTVVNLRNIR